MKVRCCKTLQPHLVLYSYLGLHVLPSRPHGVGNKKVVGVFNKHSLRPRLVLHNHASLIGAIDRTSVWGYYVYLCML